MSVLGRSLVTPLEAGWQGLLDEVAREARLPTSPAELVPLLAALSATYNDGRAPERQQSLLAPRLLFSLPRDLQKGAAAVRELVSLGFLGGAAKPLRIVDLGAGLGAATLGIARALDAAHRPSTISATFVDQDAPALRLGARVLAKAAAAGLLRSTIAVEERATSLEQRLVLPPADVVVACQVLCELDLQLAAAPRLARLVERATRWLDLVADDGSLVIIEPALRDRTRMLHRVRDALVAGGRANVFAPCLHTAPCPALADESDWCHEDLDCDLPSWLQPIAKQAGLRFQGLTFSYLVLRKDGRSLAGERPSAILRAVSDARPQKGKCERFLCGRFADGDGRARAVLLDRHATDDNQAFADAPRGALYQIAPTPTLQSPRLAPGVLVNTVEI